MFEGSFHRPLILPYRDSAQLSKCSWLKIVSFKRNTTLGIQAENIYDRLNELGCVGMGTNKLTSERNELGFKLKHPICS
jgi:hypothetical protein